MNICNKGANEDNELYNIYVKSSVIEISDCLKLLDVTIDSSLNFSDHINSICVKARSTCILALMNTDSLMLPDSMMSNDADI